MHSEEFSMLSAAGALRISAGPCHSRSLPQLLHHRAASFVVIGLVFLFALNSRAQIGFEAVRSFGIPEGMGDSASSGVIEGGDHKLYGTTVSGGMANLGVVYRMGRDG